ncbi:hypothetical protein KJA16_00635 [Patescibacteria group bacterium]|nr:hypothetical protein [Patescibacteria group bacterium]
MYKYSTPKPIEIGLAGPKGYELRLKAVQFVEKVLVRGPEAGRPREQTYGALAEIVVRKELGLPEIDPITHPKGFDFPLKSGVKVDVKCRGGIRPFQELYAGSDGMPREAKHNLFARQVYDRELDTDIYLMTHLETPKNGELPGTPRQKKWKLYICGWVSKERVKREGVYLPPGSLSERGISWFPYRSHEIEFYNKNLNGFPDPKDLLKLEPKDIEADIKKKGGLNLTSVDVMRMAIDLAGRGVISGDIVKFLKGEINLKGVIKPMLHPNQYFYLMRWLKSIGKIGEEEMKRLEEIFTEENFTGL